MGRRQNFVRCQCQVKVTMPMPISMPMPTPFINYIFMTILLILASYLLLFLVDFSYDSRFRLIVPSLIINEVYVCPSVTQNNIGWAKLFGNNIRKFLTLMEMLPTEGIKLLKLEISFIPFGKILPFTQ